MHVKDEVTNTIVIEKSRFIAYLKPIFSEDEYKQYLKDIRKKHYDATHVCSGVICGNIIRSSDDGEPSGTAGVPILNVLKKKGLDNTCALVVRYFGGIKLGAGGLIRAYSTATSETLKYATFVEEVKYNLYNIKVSYELANKLENLLEKNTYLFQKEYDEEVSIDFVLKEEKTINKIVEITKGIAPKLIKEVFIQKVVE